MTYVNFTESEKEIIRDTLKLVIKDIDQLWSYDMCSKICIPISLEDVDKYYEDYKTELEREFVLKNYNRCHFEEVLLQKCNEEISKCDEGLLISTLSGGENLSGIFKDKSEKSITT